MSGVHGAIESRVEGWVSELKDAIGAASTSIGSSGTRSTASTIIADAPSAVDAPVRAD
jgi:hypothetical protein